MKILFVTLEQSARENVKALLNNKFFHNNIDKFYTFGMSDEDLVFNDLTNINIQSLMGIVDILVKGTPLQILLKSKGNPFGRQRGILSKIKGNPLEIS